MLVKPIRLLLIEDSSLDAELVEAYLGEAEKILGRSFLVTHSSTLTAGLKTLETQEIDIALFDLNLPDSEPSQTLVKLDRVTRDIPVIVLTGQCDPDWDSMSFTKGAQDYLLKSALTGSSLARVIRYGLERHLFLKKIHELSIRDGLTNLYNRRYFDEIMTHECVVAKRTNTPLSCLMIDIDHFKSVNDTYGHQEGDRALTVLANLLQDHCRESDTITRYGGDEIVVLLPNTDRNGAYTLAEKICQNVQKHQVLSAELGVTVSIGAATRSSGCINSRELVAAADKALYQAKLLGRNRVEVELLPDMP